MSTKEVYTRAVYKFFDRATNDSLIFYKHHDGYPHGWFGALERIKAVLVLGAFNDLKVIKKVMLEVGAKELRDEMEADRVEQQHRYNVDLDDGQVTLPITIGMVTKINTTTYLSTLDGNKDGWTSPFNSLRKLEGRPLLLFVWSSGVNLIHDQILFLLLYLNQGTYLKHNLNKTRSFTMRTMNLIMCWIMVIMSCFFLAMCVWTLEWQLMLCGIAITAIVILQLRHELGRA